MNVCFWVNLLVSSLESSACIIVSAPWPPTGWSVPGAVRDFPLLNRLFVNEERTLTDITRGAFGSAPRPRLKLRKDWLISSKWPVYVKFIDNIFMHLGDFLCSHGGGIRFQSAFIKFFIKIKCDTFFWSRLLLY